MTWVYKLNLKTLNKFILLVNLKDKKTTTMEQQCFSWLKNENKLNLNFVFYSDAFFSDAYILVTWNILVTRTIAAACDNLIQRNKPLTAATQAAFKNCAPF